MARYFKCKDNYSQYSDNRNKIFIPRGGIGVVNTATKGINKRLLKGGLIEVTEQEYLDFKGVKADAPQGQKEEKKEVNEEKVEEPKEPESKEEAPKPSEPKEKKSKSTSKKSKTSKEKFAELSSKAKK